jgi:hypothetical protein
MGATATVVTRTRVSNDYEVELLEEKLLEEKRQAKRLARIRRRRIRFIKETTWLVTRLLVSGISMLGAVLSFLMGFILFYNAGYVEAALFLFSSIANVLLLYVCLDSVSREYETDQKRARG